MWKKTTRVHVVDEMDEEMVVCNKDEEMELGGRGKWSKKDQKSPTWSNHLNNH